MAIRTGGKKLVALLAAMAAAISVAAASEEKCDRVKVGDPVPDYALASLVSTADYAALGIGRSEGPVNLREIGGEILLFEIFNRYCYSCWQQAPEMESFWKRLGDEGLRGRVRLIGVAAGNDTADILQFRREHKVSYPMAPDPEFASLLPFGDPGGAPVTFFLTKMEGRWVIADARMGVEGSNALMDRVRALLEGGGAPPPSVVGAALPDRPEPPEMSDEERVEVVKKLFRQVTGRDVGIRPVEKSTALRIFQAVGEDGTPLDLYARVSRRRPVCDLCHTNVFAFAFDREGKVRGFLPVYASKVGNEPWNEKDTAKFSARLSGRSMADPGFDPEVDAVSGATLSSSLIYDEIRRTALFLRSL
jgi:hypothetical protein